MKNEHASRRLALGLCLGLVIGVDSAPVSADPDPNWADDGRWIPPQPNDPDTPPQEADYCWPAGAIHLVHIPYRDPQSQKLVCRMLVWYAPGCEDVDDGDSDCGTTPEVGISPRLWNPVDGTYISLQSPTVEIEPNVEREVLQFCNGHAALKDGRIVVIGGGGCGCDQISDQTLIFDPTMIPASSSSQDDPWSTGHVMNHKRWYPSATTLADGRILATSGSTTCSDYSMVLTPELYDPALDEWMEVDVDNLHLNFYPYMFVLPSMYIQGVVLPSQTRLAMAGPGSFSGATYPGLSTMTLTLDLSGSTPAGTWASVATHSEVRLYGAHGSAVMFQPGQILKAGGYNIGLNLPGTQTPDCGGYEQAGIIKFVNDNGTPNTSLGWSEDSSLDMFNPRKDHNLVILADGRVAAIGGSANCDPIDPANPGCDPEFEDCHECLLGCVPVYIAE